MLELRRDSPVYVPQYKNGTPRLNAGDVPLELRGPESARFVADWPDVAIVMGTSQATINLPPGPRFLSRF